MTALQNVLMRRTAPPPYAEAMLRSRPFEEVHQEYLEAMEQQRLTSESPDMALTGEEQSAASSSVVSPDFSSTVFVVLPT